MDFRIRCGSVNIDASQIISFELNSVSNSGSALTMGCAVSSSITVKMYNTTHTILSNNILIPQYTLGGSWESLGKFWVTDISIDDDITTITAYDGISKLNKAYTSNLGGTVTLQQIYNDIRTAVNGCGVEMATMTCPNYSTTTFSSADMTVGQALGYLAGCLGGYAKGGEDGDIFISYYPSRAFSGYIKDECIIGRTKKLTDAVSTIKSLVTGTKDNPISRGDGTLGIEIKYENPWITGDMATAVYNAVVNQQFQPFEATITRDLTPILAGERSELFTEELPVFITETTIVPTNDGWCQTVRCCGESEAAVEFNTEYSSISDIKQNYTDWTQAIIDATQAITGNRGGYVVLHDTNNDGKPEEILVMDQPSINDAVNVWRWNQAGLGHSSTGYNGTYDTAITAAGVINANFVAAGVLSGITIRGNTINGNTITGGTISGATIEAEDGTIGGWTIDEDDIHATTTATVSGNTYNVRTALLDTGKLSYTAWPEGGSQTGAAAIEPGCSASGTVGLTLQGPFTYNYGSLITDTQTATALNIAATRNIYAGTADMTAGTSPLAQGRIYLCYEV